MRKLNVNVTTEDGELLDHVIIELPDEDDDIDQLVISASKARSSILRHQVGSLTIGPVKNVKSPA